MKACGPTENRSEEGVVEEWVYHVCIRDIRIFANQKLLILK